jgi:hypothetical protein
LQGEKCHHGQFPNFTVIGEQLSCKENKSGLHHEQSENGAALVCTKQGTYTAIVLHNGVEE